MEKEVQMGISRLKIFDNNLSFLNDILDLSKAYFVNDLEIEPFDKFSLGFSSEYWFLQYQLLKEKQYLIDDNFNFLFIENNINITSINISDLSNYNLKCVDGTWYIEILKLGDVTNNIVMNLKNKNFF